MSRSLVWTRKNVCVFFEGGAESVDGVGVASWGVQCEVDLSHVVRYRTPEAKKCFALVIIEPMKKFRRRLFGGSRRGIGGGSLRNSGNVALFIVLD